MMLLNLFKFSAASSAINKTSDSELPKNNTNSNLMDEETIALILHGSELARNLEANIHNSLVTQQNIMSPLSVSETCDEILQVFINARKRLRAQEESLSSLHPQMLLRERLESEPLRVGAGVDEWLPSSSTQQAIMKRSHIGDQLAMVPEAPADQGGSARISASEGTSLAAKASGSSRETAAQRSRKRKENGTYKRTIMVAAPMIGNTEIPPEDGFTWRKYGQKEILGSKYPRGYYRCTHQKLYNCPAKKQVQRLDDDPYTFHITYRDDHTCHMSSTAPSIAPPSSDDLTQLLTTQMLHSSMSHTLTAAEHMLASIPPATTWLSMDVRATERQLFSCFAHGEERSSGAGPASTSVHGYGGKEVVDYQPVVDMADAMFNSGSSSNTSMDLIFSSIDDVKWQEKHQKHPDDTNKN